MGGATCPKSQCELIAEPGVEPGRLCSFCLTRVSCYLEERLCSCILGACGTVYLWENWRSPALALWPYPPLKLGTLLFLPQKTAAGRVPREEAS